MAGKADVLVRFTDDFGALSVKCAVTFENPVNTFTFSLSSLLVVDSILSDVDSQWKTGREWNPRFQHKSNEYVVSGEASMREITIAYHGKVSGWCNIVEKRRIALSAYSAWTISETSVPLDFLFKMEGMEDYFVIHARYDEAEKLWVYGETNHDTGNIIALKKGHYHTARAGSFSFYFLNEAERAYAESYAYYYDDIMKYYLSVFPQKNIGNMNVVSLGFKKGSGAYFREELIVIEKINFSKRPNKMRDDVVSLLAHELGHNWFFRANTSSWEDWLNETGAEWAALLYILSIGNQKLFSKKIKQGKMAYKRTPVIKPPDLARPAKGVHTRGVMLFYQIYRKHGAETILELLRLLAGLEEVTTDRFLSEVRAQMGDTIYHLIAQGLTAAEYTSRKWGSR